MPNNKIYPPEVEQLFKDDPKHYFPGSLPAYPFPKCDNCGDGRSLAYFHLKSDEPSGPSSRGNTFMTINGVEGWYDTELLLCPCPACQGDQVIRNLRASCGLEGPDLDVSLVNFAHTGALAGKDRAYRVVDAIIGSNGKAGFYTFYGDYGVGKSHLLMAIVNAAVSDGIPARYVVMADLLSEIKATFAGNGISQEQIEARYRNAPVLCIDEVDRVKLTDWAQETIFKILDARYKSRLGMLTVMATNTAPKNFPPALGYLKSRMIGGMIVQVEGPDMRPAVGAIEQKAQQVSINFHTPKDDAQESADVNPAIAQAVAATAERLGNK